MHASPRIPSILPANPYHRGMQFQDRCFGIIFILLLLVLDRSQNYAFILHLFALHFICITFAFHLHFA